MVNMEELTFENLPRCIAELRTEVRNMRDILSQCMIEPKSSSEEILTVQGAAKFLRLSVPTIYGLVHRRELPHSKKGKRLYFSLIQLQEWIQQGKRKTMTELENEAANYLVRRKGVKS